MLRREVPQEHSHDVFLSITNEALAKSNPKGIKDAVFGLLGNAAAAGGAGSVTNLDCLKQETADQAFTNAKAAGDIRLMAGALVYQALERNTGKVGLASVACTEQAVNPEIQAVKPHQDPASANAASINKGITLELAKQLKAIGADPNLALLSGTFAPGDLNDATAKGKTCDDPDPTLGCIYSTGTLVLDASQEEVASAAAAVSQTFTGTGGIQATDLVDLNKFSTAKDQGNGAAPTPSANVATASQPAAVATPTEASKSTPAASEASTTSGNNVQTFTGTLGGPPPPVISGTGNRPFSVNGDTFVTVGAALQRSCSIQHNACANAANSGKLSGGVGQCDTQNTQCTAAVTSGAANNNAGNNNRNNNNSSNNNGVGSAGNDNSANGNAAGATGSFGSCSNPSIKFANGLDGRNEPAFAPVDEKDFNHGSALNIKVIADFICDRLNSSCKAGAAVVSKCQSASAAASQLQGQAAADAFNKALGVSAN
ncbi:pathogenicity cluster 5 protein d [Trichoderma asperellum]|uniref:Pathogenicity cluster 5 protein d n=1 Tax=Trichoderma asperellum TaxID=101201 RepID=A0A6V8QZD1_TRIAP|nr:pathogenicity cluster 5 protein d [Trichoderma asperellum]